MTEVVFVAAALAAIVSAVGVVASPNPVHSALNLVGTLFAVAVMFVLQEAHFLAAVQVIVYAGAVVVLFLFVIMLLGVDERESLHEPLTGQRWAAIGAAVIAFVGLVILVTGEVVTGQLGARGPVTGDDRGNVERIGESLFTDFVWPFEMTGVLLVIAVLGAIVLVRELRAGEPGEAEEAGERVPPDGDGEERRPVETGGEGS